MRLLERVRLAAAARCARSRRPRGSTAPRSSRAPRPRPSAGRPPARAPPTRTVRGRSSACAGRGDRACCRSPNCRLRTRRSPPPSRSVPTPLCDNVVRRPDLPQAPARGVLKKVGSRRQGAAWGAPNKCGPWAAIRPARGGAVNGSSDWVPKGMSDFCSQNNNLPRRHASPGLVFHRPPAGTS